ncbi:MAG: MoxR family ATPase [Planctomycetes bacterium]|nr:MoxR family ATPase [Planctomycetota bacterium]
MSDDVKQKAQAFREDFAKLKNEVAKVIVGHENIVEGVLTCLFIGGHCLLEGVPGLGKTLLVRTLSEVLDLQFNRIQFTPDLMPADIIGTNIITETDTGQKEFRFQKGPVFAQIILADEINRATPKTQSAMLEAMQEQTVTVAGTRYDLEQPFVVMATQNPIEMEGTYPLPEAQLDRFLVKMNVAFSNLDELQVILDRTTGRETPKVGKVMDGPTILEWRGFIRDVVAAPHIKDYAARMILATHPDSEHATGRVRQYVLYGASPRGAQALLLCGKVRALVDGRYNLSFEDIQTVAHGALRHRMILNFEGEAENMKTDTIIDQIIDELPKEAPAKAEATSG